MFFLLTDLNSSEYYALEIDMIKNWHSHFFNESSCNDSLKDGQHHTDFLNFRFGYHQALVPGIFSIILKFATNPGNHIRKRFWHSTQRFELLSDHSVIMYLKVEINIELLGWIMMWMDNVQVLEPQILVDLVQERLASMRDVHALKKAPINNG